MTTPLKYVVSMVNDGIAIGPFGSEPEAHAYRDTDLDRDKMQILMIQAPEDGWKKRALTNWPNGIARNHTSSGSK